MKQNKITDKFAPLNSRNETIQALILRLVSSDGDTRKAARLSLIESGAPVIDELSNMIDAPEAILRWEVVKILAQIEDDKIAPALVKALGDEAGGIRCVAEEGLVRLGQPAIEPLLDMLSAGKISSTIQKSAYHVMSQIAVPEMNSKVALLLNVLRNNNNMDNIQALSKDLFDEMRAGKEQIGNPLE